MKHKCKISGFIMAIFLCLLYVTIPRQAEAKEDPVAATSSFLRISVDARGTAMGNAHGAVTDDVYSMYWNPAGLANVLLKEVGITYQRAFQDLSYSFLGYAAPTRFGTLAGQSFFLSSGSITATYENEDGSFKGMGESFSVIDFGLGVSQSRKIMSNFSYGLSLKLLAHRIKDEQAFSLAADAGIIYQDVIEGFDLGVAVQNISTKYRFMTQDLHEPRNFRMATIYSLLEDKLLLAGDYNLIFGQKDELSIGAEYWALDLIALRAGMKLPPPAGLLSSLNMGFGVNWRDTYRLDYSFSLHTELGASQRFSIIFRF